MSALTSGKVAKQAGVNIETLRYYERQGLLARPSRAPSNYRLYTEEAVHRLRFIKRTQGLGFTLREIKEMLSLQAERGTGCAEIQKHAMDKIKEIDEKIQTLYAMKRALSKLVAQCSGKGSITECPILEAITERGEDKQRSVPMKGRRSHD
jgi:MerR family mercuric resistance operon transcriptional regulator